MDNGKEEALPWQHGFRNEELAASLTPEQAEAMLVSPGHSLDTQARIAFVQERYFRVELASAWTATYLYRAKSQQILDAPLPLDDLLANLAIWPLAQAGNSPWTLLNQSATPVYPCVRIRQHPDSSGWEMQLLHTAWDPHMDLALEQHLLSNPVRRKTIDELTQSLPDSYFAFLANPIVSVIAAYRTTSGAMPSAPSDAFRKLRFAVNQEVISRVKAEFPRAEFRKAADNSAWGLLMERADGSQVILAQGTQEIGTGSMMRNLGWRGSPVEAQGFLDSTDSWGSLYEQDWLVLDLSEALLAGGGMTKRGGGTF